MRRKGGDQRRFLRTSGASLWHSRACKRMDFGRQTSGRSDRECLERRCSPASPRGEPGSSCLPVVKCAKSRHGLSVRRGKYIQRHNQKVLSGRKTFVQRSRSSKISGTSISDSSIKNRNRILLLQQELNAEGVWEVGKWLGAAFVGQEAEVIARIRALEERDKVMLLERLMVFAVVAVIHGVSLESSSLLLNLPCYGSGL
ncbi:hypothetical protein Ancab_030201 [Ancistrocladus abbreviatus]